MYNKYKFYVNKEKKEVIAVCRYAGRTVRAKAKCRPEDTFDIEKGKELAYKRAEVKVKKIKQKNAAAKYAQAIKQMFQADEYSKKMFKYYSDAALQYCEAAEELENLEKTY